VSDALFSPDGRYILTLIKDYSSTFSQIKFWNIANGEELKQFIVHQGDVQSIVYSPDQKSILTASDNGTACIWDVTTGKELLRLDHKSVKQLNSAKFSPDGKLIVTSSGSDIGIVWIWNAKTGELLHALKGTAKATLSSGFSPDSKLVIISSSDNIRIWNVVSGEEIQKLSSYMYYVGYSPDRLFFVTEGFSGVFVCNATTYEQLYKLEGRAKSEKLAIFSTVEKFILTLVFSDNTARMWDMVIGKELHKFQHADHVNSAEFSPDGRFVITASDDKTTRIWDTTTGKNLCTFEPTKNIKEDPFSRESVYLRQVKSASFSPDGKFIMTSTDYEGSNVTIWNLTENKEN
jgi:WD40 repeat protein